MPKHGYLVADYEFDSLSEKDSAFLSATEITIYMQLVGIFIWFVVLRVDTTFTVTYLTWFTKKPRVHHMKMALYLLSYLYYSKDIPLVLGGVDKLQIITYTDSSTGTGPKGRSVSGLIGRLGSKAGAVCAKSHATHTVRLSSFESELEANAQGMKTSRRLDNTTTELMFEMSEQPVQFCDNEAMIDFVKGEGEAKGVRHMELRMWYIREQYARGNLDIQYMPGVLLCADKCTKACDRKEIEKFRYDVQGLELLENSSTS
jgi:hypothetical protein